MFSLIESARKDPPAWLWARLISSISTLMSPVTSHSWRLSFPTNVSAVTVCPQSADVCEQILRVVSRSGRLEELVLDNAGLKTWGCQTVLQEKTSYISTPSEKCLGFHFGCIFKVICICRELFPPRINIHTHTHVHDCAWACIMKAGFDSLQWLCSEVGGCPGPQPQLRSHHPQSRQQPPGGQRYQYPHPLSLI